MYKRFVMFLVLTLTVAFAAAAQDEPSVDEVVKRANHMAYYQGKDGGARVKMTITDAQGRTRNKEFSIIRMNKGDSDVDGDQNFYVYFHAPADERGTVFMVWKHLGKDDDRWLYLPGLDVTKRIAASDDRTSFVGSHFLYEDVSGRDLDEDDHEFVSNVDEKTAKSYYVVKNTPIDKDSVEFDSYTMWVHKGTFFPTQITFEKDGKVYRKVSALAFKDIQGKKTVVKARIDDTNIGGYTVVEYSNVEYDRGLTNEIFTERYLRNPPKKYLK